MCRYRLCTLLKLQGSQALSLLSFASSWLCTLLKLQGSQALIVDWLQRLLLCTLLKLQGSQACAAPRKRHVSFVLC